MAQNSAGHETKCILVDGYLVVDGRRRGGMRRPLTQEPKSQFKRSKIQRAVTCQPATQPQLNSHVCASRDSGDAVSTLLEPISTTLSSLGIMHQLHGVLNQTRAGTIDRSHPTSCTILQAGHVPVLDNLKTVVPIHRSTSRLPHYRARKLN